MVARCIHESWTDHTAWTCIVVPSKSQLFFSNWDQAPLITMIRPMLDWFVSLISAALQEEEEEEEKMPPAAPALVSSVLMFLLLHCGVHSNDRPLNPHSAYIRRKHVRFCRYSHHSFSSFVGWLFCRPVRWQCGGAGGRGRRGAQAAPAGGASAAGRPAAARGTPAAAPCRPAIAC